MRTRPSVASSPTRPATPRARLSLIELGTATLALSGANSFTGSTTVNSGTLKLTQQTGWKSNVTVDSGAVDEVNQTGRLQQYHRLHDFRTRPREQNRRLQLVHRWWRRQTGVHRQRTSGCFDFQQGSIQQGGTANSGFNASNYGSLNIAPAAPPSICTPAAPTWMV